MQNNCVFCKIVAGEIPSHKVYEDDRVLAFLDIRPSNPGHTLLISKEHYNNTLETPEDILKHMISVAKKIAPKIIEAVKANASNIIMNNGADAGQIIFHTHWHIIPRFQDDGHKHWAGKEYKEGEVEDIAEKIMNNI